MNLYKVLTKDQSEFVLSNHLLRCGISIGANVEEAIGIMQNFGKNKSYHDKSKKNEKLVKILRIN